MTGMLARTGVNSNLSTYLGRDHIVTGAKFQPLVWQQIKAIGVTLLLATIGTAIIAFAVKAIVGLRPSAEVEVAGLDLSEPGEEGYTEAR